MMGARELEDQIKDGTCKADGDFSILKQLASTCPAHTRKPRTSRNILPTKRTRERRLLNDRDNFLNLKCTSNTNFWNAPDSNRCAFFLTVFSMKFLGWLMMFGGAAGAIHAFSMERGWSGFFFDLLTGIPSLTVLRLGGHG